MKQMQFTIDVPKWHIEELTGYKPQTTFWTDFCIAEKYCGKMGIIAAVKDTFNRAFAEWRTDKIYITELALVLNHRAWAWSDVCERLKKELDEKADKEDGLSLEKFRVVVASKIRDLYSKLYYVVVDWARVNLPPDDVDYFNATID